MYLGLTSSLPYIQSKTMAAPEGAANITLPADQPARKAGQGGGAVGGAVPAARVAAPSRCNRKKITAPAWRSCRCP